MPSSKAVKAEEYYIRYLVDLTSDHNLSAPVDDEAKPAAPKDWTHAIETGWQAEIDNIAMNDTFPAQNLLPGIRQVFEHLKTASQNRLRAFTNKAGD